jgi:hypothetical protein
LRHEARGVAGRQETEGLPSRVGQRTCYRFHGEATHYPDVLRHVQEGVVGFLVRLARPDAPAVTSERVTPDHIVFAYDYTGAFEPR